MAGPFETHMKTKGGQTRITIYVPPSTYGNGSRLIGVLR